MEPQKALDVHGWPCDRSPGASSEGWIFSIPWKIAELKNGEGPTSSLKSCLRELNSEATLDGTLHVIAPRRRCRWRPPASEQRRYFCTAPSAGFARWFCSAPS